MHTNKCFGKFRLFKPLDARGLLLWWLAHLVLHGTDEAQLGRNSHIIWVKGLATCMYNVD